MALTPAGEVPIANAFTDSDSVIAEVGGNTRRITPLAFAEVVAAQVATLAPFDTITAETEADALATAADATQTALDRVATGADVVTSTGLLADTQTARDATQALANSAGAYADTTIAASVATAEAALIVGDFYTATGDDVTYVALFEIETGPVSTELYRFPKTAYIDEKLVPVALSGVSDWTPDTLYSLGILTNTGTIAAQTIYWGASAIGVKKDALLESFEVKVLGDLTGQVAVVDANNIVTDFYDFAVVGVGNKVVTPTRPIRVGTGSQVYVKPNNNNLEAIATAVNPTKRFLETEFDGTIGDYVLVSTTNSGVSFKINLIESDVTIPDRLADLDIVSEPDTALTVSGTTFEDATLIFPAGSPSIQGIARAADAGVDFPAGAVVRSAHADLRLYSTADFVRVTLLKRLTSAGSSAWVSSVDGPAFQTQQFPVTDIDPDIDTAGTSRLTFPIDPFIVEDGYSYFVVVQQFTADFVGVNMAIGRGSNSLNNRQHSRGWFAANVNVLPTSVLTSPSYACLGFDWKAVPQAIEKAGYARIADASLSISGTTATVKARTDDGTVGARYFGTTGTATIALCAAGNSRYDVLWMNVRTMTFGVTTGDERTTDTAEFVPDVGDPNRIALFHVLVDDAGYDYVPVWHLVAGDAPAYRNDLMAQLDRSRAAIPKTLAKLRRGDPVHIVQTGDSIAAAQSGTASESLPNTVNRDRYETYLTTYGADYKAAIPLYSATDFGRTDDGAGAIYAAITSVAQTVIAMRAAGYAVQYDNFAIGSKNTSHIVGAAAPYAVTTWYQNTLDLAGDLMIFHFGMNDDATSDLAAAMVAAINFAKTAGYECLVIGRARRDEAFYNQQTFHKSNKYLRDAAEYAGAAFIDVAALYTDDAAGVLGLSPLSYCQANNNNHPGVREMAATSRALLKVLT